MKLDANSVFNLVWKKAVDMCCVVESEGNYQTYLNMEREAYDKLANHYHYPTWEEFYPVFCLTKEEYEAIMAFAREFYDYE